MPILLDRRSFLKHSLAAAAVVSSARFAQADSKSESHWALLSDVHIAADKGDTYRGFHPHENLKSVLDQLQPLPFDSLLINGDLARMEGRPADYEILTGYLAPVTEKLPIAITLGNHDDRKNARSAFANISGEVQTVEKKLVTTLDAGPVQFVLLDSLMATNIAAGQLGNSQRQWLSGVSARERRFKPVIIFVHHNPDPESDSALVDAERLLEIALPAKQVKAVVFGHTHTWRHETQKGLHLVNLPAVAYNFADGEPVGWTDALFSATGAKLKLNAIGGNTRANGEQLNLNWRS